MKSSGARGRVGFFSNAYERLLKATDEEIDAITADRIHRTLDRRAEEAKAFDPEKPRPIWVSTSDVGQIIRISIKAHDDYYRYKRNQFRRRLKDLHPDAINRDRILRKEAGEKVGGRAALLGVDFIAVQKSFRVWMREERDWYWTYRLMPPDWKGAVQEPPQRRPGRSQVHLLESGYADSPRHGRPSSSDSRVIGSSEETLHRGDSSN